MTQVVLAADYCSLGSGREWSYTGDVNGFPVTFAQSVIAAGKEGSNFVYTLDSRMNGTAINTFKFTLQGDSLFIESKENSFGETVYFSPPRKEMMCNAKVGDKWAWKSKSSSDHLKYEAIRKEKVSVPAGEFDALVISTKGVIDGKRIKESLTWYADGVGTVKEFANIGSIEMIRKLSSYKRR